MSETTEKRSVRITLLDSGLSPPIFILASFTDPPWEPHEMKSAVAGGSGVNGDNPTVNNVDYMFWRRFDIYPGVWRYRFRVGLSDWLMHNYQAEVGKEYNMKILKLKLIHSLQRMMAQANVITSLESRTAAQQSFSHQRRFRSR